MPSPALPHIPALIAKKRDGDSHTRAELQALINGYLAEQIPDYQLSAWLMAVFLRGMTSQETAWLTQIMAASGEQLDLQDLPYTVDKHSTGGVGDKTSLVLAPMLAALGLTVAKMSGRGLAHTGGTIDKLESIKGWRPQLSESDFYAQARKTGLVLVGQSKQLAPADGLLYALRDVTATVPSLPLIASSIMSKKLAAGAKTIVLDVKVGSGAFMETLEQGRELARLMIEIGQQSGRRVRALLTNMNAPLGKTIGNALEVREAVVTLQGAGPSDLTTLCVALASEALVAHGESIAVAEQRARQTLQDGSALNKFAAFVAAQGGETSFMDSVNDGVNGHTNQLIIQQLGNSLGISQQTSDFTASQQGYLQGIEAESMGRAALALGGGRSQKGQAIDHGVGLEILAEVGQSVELGQPLVRIYHHAEKGLEIANQLIRESLKLGPTPPDSADLLLGRL